MTDQRAELPPQLLQRLERGCTPAAARLLRACVDEAERRGEPLYLTGGALRDLLRSDLLRGDPLKGGGGRGGLRELDLVLEGEVEALARAAARSSGAELALFPRFLTARLRLAGATLDLARARRERYPKPAALPLVRPAPIAEDLPRRDFSVNTMALTLSGAPALKGALLDPCGGLDDLAAGRIRVLHARSFIDDPTRLLRACRYAARLEGRLTRESARLLKRDAKGLRRLSRDRLGAEWRRLLEDAAAEGALRRAAGWGLTEADVRGWRPAPRLLRAWARLGEGGQRGSAHFWALSGLVEEPALAARVTARCALRREEQRALESGGRLRRRRVALGAPSLAPSAASALLRGEAPAALEAAAVLWPGRAGERVRSYLSAWRAVESPLSARELGALGLRGAALGAWRSRLREALLDGELPGAQTGSGAKRAACAWVRRESGRKVG